MQRQLPCYAGAPLTVMATMHRCSSCPHVVVGHLGRHHHLLLRLHTEDKANRGEACQNKAGTDVCTGQGGGKMSQAGLATRGTAARRLCRCAATQEHVGCLRNAQACSSVPTGQPACHVEHGAQRRQQVSSSSRMCQRQRSPRAQAWSHPSTAPRGPPRQTRSCRPAASPGRRTWTPAWFGGQCFGSEREKRQ